MKKNKQKYTDEEIKEAFEATNIIKEAINHKNSFALMIGMGFSEARDNGYFERLNIQEKDFLGEIGLNSKTLNLYENVYKAFVKVGGYKIQDLTKNNDIFKRLKKIRSKLFKIKREKLPELKVEKEELDEWVGKAINLSTSSFNLEFQQMFGKKIDADHECEWNHKEHWVCSICGEKVYFDPNTNKHKCKK